ncbi:hypothetical protein DH2020_034529 [Rehmannia glutinosa]|uniref:DUF1985 domain-containing protein n=1 Tax=Rehmannia glutinosa TaxID=99300 RepID=A0ABR0V937_REHGL
MSSEEEGREVGSGEEESSEDEQPRKRQRIDQDYPGTQIRAKPKVIVDVLSALKPALKSAVIEMGFGSLFSLKIDDFNKKLTYWLVENFNALSSELVFEDGRRIHLEREDVGRVLGFPDGDIVIEKKKKSGKCALYDEWKTMFPNFHKVTAGDLAVRMMQCVDGGDWFRRHFVTLVDSVLIGNLQSGYINPLILNRLDDVSKIREFNWWDYTLNTLLSKRVKWDETNKYEFNGPVLLLTVFYLDRVSVLGRDVPRTLPAFAPWTMEKVKKRIRKEFLHGGFGQGYVEAPYVGVVPLQPRLEGLVADQGKQSFLPGTSSAGGGGRLVFWQGYIAKIKSRISCLASDVVEIISLIRDAPSEVTEVPEFSEIGVVAKNLICYKTVHAEGTRGGDDVVGSESQQAEAFWSNPENIAMLEKMEAALCKRDEFEKWSGDKHDKPDKPSFSLGLTQEPTTDKWDTVVETSRFYEKDVAAGTLDEQAGQEQATDDLKVDDVGSNMNVDDGLGVGLAGNEIPKKNSEKMPVYRRNEPRKKKKTETLTSPFVERRVDVLSKLNEQQNMIVKWLFENPEAEKDEAIFKAGDMIITREDFLFSIVTSSETTDDGRSFALFSQSLDAEIGDAIPKKLQAYEMSEHLFVIVFDMKRSCVQILDNSSVGGTKCDKYEDVPAKLVSRMNRILLLTLLPLPLFLACFGGNTEISRCEVEPQYVSITDCLLPIDGACG